MTNLITQLNAIKIIPVIEIEDAEMAVPLAGTLIENGLAAAEISFRTKTAGEAITRIKDAYPDLLLGAGTVLTTQQVDQAYRSGASFMVSPGLNPRTVNHCLDRGITTIPGVNNPSHIEQGLELGLDFLKFFPAEASGGVAMLKSVLAPYADLKLMPTGGVNAGNINNYLAIERVVCCAGTWMVPAKLINEENWNGIGRLVRQAVELVDPFEISSR